MQAILTRFVGPTNTRGSRIIASCDARRLTVSWNYALSIDDNHRGAALALMRELDWHGEIVSGWLPKGGGLAHVFTGRPDEDGKR